MKTVIELHAQHVDASQKRDDAARRAIAAFEAGNTAAGEEAAEEAEWWDLITRSLEPDSGITQR
jgi:hypothetical protein